MTNDDLTMSMGLCNEVVVRSGLEERTDSCRVIVPATCPGAHCCEAGRSQSIRWDEEGISPCLCPLRKIIIASE